MKSPLSPSDFVCPDTAVAWNTIWKPLLVCAGLGGGGGSQPPLPLSRRPFLSDPLTPSEGGGGACALHVLAFSHMFPHIRISRIFPPLPTGGGGGMILSNLPSCP